MLPFTRESWAYAYLLASKLGDGWVAGCFRRNEYRCEINVPYLLVGFEHRINACFVCASNLGGWEIAVYNTVMKHAISVHLWIFEPLGIFAKVIVFVLFDNIALHIISCTSFLIIVHSNTGMHLLHLLQILVLTQTWIPKFQPCFLCHPSQRPLLFHISLPQLALPRCCSKDFLERSRSSTMFNVSVTNIFRLQRRVVYIV